MLRTLPAHVFRRMGSVWFGVSMLALIFLYSSIGSALPPVRQGALADVLGLEFLRFEKTEMQWFCWWPFTVMVGLFCVGMVSATLRIRLNAVNAGVWGIHLGMLVLAISSAVYFASKVEGDTVIFHSQALVLAPGMTEPVGFVVRPGGRASLGPEGHKYSILVMQIDPDAVATVDGKERKTPAIWLLVQPPDGASRFVRRLLLGYPELTDDYVVGTNGLVRAAERLDGGRLVDAGLQVQLWYDPAKYFYVNETAAVYARFSSDEPWVQLRAGSLPRYFEYVDEPGAAWVAPGENAPLLRPLGILLEAAKHQQVDAVQEIAFRITAYLPYATDTQTQDGDDARPMIVPRWQRQPASLVRDAFSRVRVEVRNGEWSHKVWLRYHEYAFDDAQRAQPGRFIFEPAKVQMPDGRTLELLFSRWRESLPVPIALDRFVLKTYPGGDQPSDYISRVRFTKNGEWGPVTEVRSNHPVWHGGYWYFQSQYDPQSQSHTVLGVGNRVGAGWMLGGVCLSIAGMLYAFYVKPAVIRRRKPRRKVAAASAERLLNQGILQEAP